MVFRSRAITAISRVSKVLLFAVGKKKGPPKRA
jgi:hypothetical protein